MNIFSIYSSTCFYYPHHKVKKWNYILIISKENINHTVNEKVNKTENKYIGRESKISYELNYNNYGSEWNYTLIYNWSWPYNTHNNNNKNPYHNMVITYKTRPSRVLL